MRFVYFILTLTIITLPILGNAQQREVVAEQGEGIYRLLTRNGLSYSEYNDAFIKLNKDRLGTNNTLLVGVKYLLPDVKTNQVSTSTLPATTATSSTSTSQGKIGTIEVHNIFGPAYKNVEITGNRLNGAVYYLVPGHGGPDPGAIGRYGNHELHEDEYAYDITLRLARNLIQEGATVYMIVIDPNDGIRDESILNTSKNEVCYPNLTIPRNNLERLKQRTDAVNKLYAQNRNAFQRMICIHIDSRSHSQNIDVFFYHDKRSTKGEKAAKILQQTFQEKYRINQPGRGYKGTVTSRNLYELRNSHPVAVFIELGNINHQRDQQRFVNVNNRQALANWLRDGLITDFQTNK